MNTAPPMPTASPSPADEGVKHFPRLLSPERVFHSYQARPRYSAGAGVLVYETVNERGEHFTAVYKHLLFIQGAFAIAQDGSLFVVSAPGAGEKPLFPPRYSEFAPWEQFCRWREEACGMRIGDLYRSSLFSTIERAWDLRENSVDAETVDGMAFIMASAIRRFANMPVAERDQRFHIVSESQVRGIPKHPCESGAMSDFIEALRASYIVENTVVLRLSDCFAIDMITALPYYTIRQVHEETPNEVLSRLFVLVQQDDGDLVEMLESDLMEFLGLYDKGVMPYPGADLSDLNVLDACRVVAEAAREIVLKQSTGEAAKVFAAGGADLLEKIHAARHDRLGGDSPDSRPPSAPSDAASSQPSGGRAERIAEMVEAGTRLAEALCESLRDLTEAMHSLNRAMAPLLGAMAAAEEAQDGDEDAQHADMLERLRAHQGGTTDPLLGKWVTLPGDEDPQP